jgi:phosphoribosyl 1,2-cyclic phosphodiesterase
MKARFWGTRGSLPVSLSAAGLRMKLVQTLLAADGRRFTSTQEAEAWLNQQPFGQTLTYGGNSSCVEFERSPPDPMGVHDYVICDMGSGFRAFGQAVMARHGPSRPQRFHIFLSHLHWDHIMGLPFFTPAYLRGNALTIYSAHAGTEAALRQQQAAPCFPVPFTALGADFQFVSMKPGVPMTVAGWQVTAKQQLHGGDSYGYRFEAEGRSLVYSTDSEHKLDRADEAEDFAGFFRNADLVVFDAMYSLADAVSVKEDWGHSSNVVGVELCRLAGVKRLALFHHEPIFSDERIAQVEADARRLEEITREDGPALAVFAAYDGLELAL